MSTRGRFLSDEPFSWCMPMLPRTPEEEDDDADIAPSALVLAVNSTLNFMFFLLLSFAFNNLEYWETKCHKLFD